jgi:hypothetical protein
MREFKDPFWVLRPKILDSNFGFCNLVLDVPDVKYGKLVLTAISGPRDMYWRVIGLNA